MAAEEQIAEHLREESESSPPTPTTFEPWGEARITDGLCARACLLIGGAPFANKKERRVVGWNRERWLPGKNQEDIPFSGCSLSQ